MEPYNNSNNNANFANFNNQSAMNQMTQYMNSTKIHYTIKILILLGKICKILH